MEKKGNAMLLVLIAVLVVAAVFVSKKNQQGSQGPYQNAPLTTGAPLYGGGSTNGQIKSSVPLTLTSVSGAMTVTNPILVVSGKTTANADVAVNDRDLKADAQGNFSTTVTLDAGENTINIVVNDAAGNSTEREFIVTLQ